MLVVHLRMEHVVCRSTMPRSRIAVPAVAVAPRVVRKENCQMPGHPSCSPKCGTGSTGDAQYKHTSAWRTERDQVKRPGCSAAPHPLSPCVPSRPFCPAQECLCGACPPCYPLRQACQPGRRDKVHCGILAIPSYRCSRDPEVYSGALCSGSCFGSPWLLLLLFILQTPRLRNVASTACSQTHIRPRGGLAPEPYRLLDAELQRSSLY